MRRAGLAGLAALAACGARSEIRGVVETSDATIADVHITDVQGDSPPIDAGPCPPLDYVVDESSSTVLAMDDTSLYFIAPSYDIVSIPKAGGAAKTITSAVGFDGDIVVSPDTNVYFTMNGVLMSHSTLGGSTTTLGCAVLAGCPGSVHVKTTTSNGFVVLVDGVQPVAFKISTSGPPIALAPANIAPPAPVHYLAATADWVFWDTDIRVFGVPFGIPEPPTVYDTSSSGLAIDSSHVYWTAITTSGTWTTFRSGWVTPAPVALSTGATHAPLVANDSSVYGVAIDGGITRQPTQGGNVDVIVPNVAPLTLLLDEQCVYFVERTDTGRRISRARN